MCGIVGYIGEGNAYNVLIGGLHRLEYRGYDSAGIALVDDNGRSAKCRLLRISARTRTLRRA